MKLVYQSMTADDGAAISFVELGSGRPLIYVNGFGEEIVTANALLERWSSQFRCLMFDHRGFGKTPFSPEASVERSARDLHCLLERLDVQDAILVGYSMGGAVAFSYFEQFGSDRLGGLVLADTAPKLINEDDWRLGLWQGRYLRADYERDLATIVDDPTLFHMSFYVRAATKSDASLPPCVFPEHDDKEGWLAQVVQLTHVREALLRRIFYVDTPPERRQSERRYWESMTDGDWRHVLSSIDVPTFCLYAEPGSFYCKATTQYMAEKIPNATFDCVSNAAHVFPKENFIEYSSKIFDFCASLPACSKK